MKLHIKVIPSSSKDYIAGWLEDALKIKVKAPPDKGKANKAIIKLIEKSLSLKKGSVSIESGFTSSRKVILIDGYDDSDITAKLITIIEKPQQ